MSFGLMTERLTLKRKMNDDFEGTDICKDLHLIFYDIRKKRGRAYFGFQERCEGKIITLLENQIN